MGIVLSIAGIGMAFISPEPYVMYGRQILLIPALYFMYKIGKDEKELNEGVLSFGEAFIAIFIGSIIAYAILNLSEFVLFNYIKPELNQITMDIAMETADKGLQWASETFDLNLEEASAEIKKEFTLEKLSRTPFNALITMISNLFTPCIFGSIFMAIFAKSKS